jgi:hypothetical protein
MIKYFTRLITAIIVIAFVIPAFAEETKLQLFDGIWSTDRGQMALWQVEGNDEVWGLYGKYGKIGGHVSSDDGIFRFIWDEGVDGRGTGWIKLKSDGKVFDGQWLTELNIAQHGSWHGDYLGPNAFEIGDQAALTWQPGTENTTEPETVKPEDTTGPSEKPSDSSTTEKPSDSATPEKEKENIEQKVNEDAGFTGDASTIWSSIWETARGELVIIVTDKKAQGTFGKSGTLQGNIDGANFSGTWSETLEDGTAIDGQFFFELNADGSEFRGSYNKTAESHLWLPWSGTKKIDSTESKEP